MALSRHQKISSFSVKQKYKDDLTNSYSDCFEDYSLFCHVIGLYEENVW